MKKILALMTALFIAGMSFAQTSADPESRKVKKMGFTSVKSLSKILQEPIETFNDSSIKFLEIS